MDFEIRLRSVQDVLSFVSMATARKFPVTVSTAQHQVNGKSFMEMFCLNLKQALTVHVECSEEEYLRFCQDAERFLVR